MKIFAKSKIFKKIIVAIIKTLYFLSKAANLIFSDTPVIRFSNIRTTLNNKMNIKK